MNNFDLLQRLEQSLKRALTTTREQIVLAGFDMFLSKTAEPSMNYAVPKTSENWDRALAELVEVCVQQQRQPRLEYFHELYPGLQKALLQAGFIQEMSAPVMILVDSDLSEQYNVLYKQTTVFLSTKKRKYSRLSCVGKVWLLVV